MAGFSNGDRAFFQVSSPDVDIDSPVINHRIISLTMTEEMAKMTTGSLRLHDPDHSLGKTFRFGVRVDVTWGYLFEDANDRAILAERINADEFKGNIARRGFRGFIVSPSGGGDQAGNITYNANLQALGFQGNTQFRSFSGVNRGDVIATLLDELGVADREIDFQSATDPTPDQGIRQDETAFAMLTRLSFEWRAHFLMGYLPNGTVAALFVDLGKLGTTEFQRKVMGSRGRSNVFDYNGPISNVISFNWRNEQGLSGKGDNAQLTVINGVPTIVRYTVENERVVAYQLDTDALREAVETATEEGGPAAATAWIKNALNAQDFESQLPDGQKVKDFFVPIETSTSPQGKGYTLQVRTKGNPLYTAGNTCTFNKGFPGWFTPTDEAQKDSINWYIRKVVHTISQQGYTCDLEIADAFAFNDIGAVFQSVGGGG